ncbi:hypothetical protein [Carboxylicivirga sp. M1479]|uniref:hypothetical protein n=1 Tax=Carboxylicivirga sp. M1479 TaxID=2594476 RepID=UPI0011787E95|nr:hypothetical protein [Carboxylicivirga sp. M1479]TRX70527.1 hypothetical protein FNN09_11150 [Carboxylicivirga sp. M1479]
MGLFKKGGFFDKITRGIDKATGGIANRVFKAVKKPAIGLVGAALAPVTGGASVALAAGAISVMDKIGETGVGKIAGAAIRDGIVKSDKIAETAAKNGVRVTKNEVHAIANAVSQAAQEETGRAVNVQSLSTSAPSRDALRPMNGFELFMQKVKAYFNRAKRFVVDNWVWFAVPLALVALVYLFIRLTGRKKWRV